MKRPLTITDSKNLDIKNIRIFSGRFGDGLDGHCDIGPESGRPPNLNADEYKDAQGVRSTISSRR